jgi:glycosyltransferase involved in cell wall biosynthesis
MPTISVIVPVYKVEEYLDRCVESILAQTFTDFELILVDDGSPDNCPAMCDAWEEKDSRIKVIHKENGGLSDARNVGFADSCGEWITFIDSDDYVHPQMLQALFDAAQKFDVKVSACGFTRTKGEPLEQKQDLTANLWNAEDLYMQRNVNATVAWGKLYHRSVVLSYPKGKLHEDEFVTYRILFACEQIAVLDDELYGYFCNRKSIVRSDWSVKRLDVLKAFKEQIEYFAKRGNIQLRRWRIREFMKNILGQLNLIADMEKPDTEGIRTLEKWGRRILRKYRADKVFVGEKDMWIYKRFYPRLTISYLYCQAVLRKLGWGK